MAGASAGPLRIGVCDSDAACDIVLEGSFCRFWETRILEEGRRLLEADGHRPVADPLETAESLQAELLVGANTLWVLDDPLDVDFGPLLQ